MSNEIIKNPLQAGPEFIEEREHQLPPANETGGEHAAEGRATDAMERAPAGEPPKDHDVRSVYDSRPVQGFDFNITDETGEGAFPFTLEFTVPEGFVCVLRALHHWFDPAPLVPSRNNVQMTLLRNGNDVRFNVDIPVGAESDELVKCFLIADEFETVGVRLTSGLAVVDTAAFVHFYGNFLLKTDSTAQFQIANPVGQKIEGPRLAPAPLVQPRQDPTPVAIQPTMTAPSIKAPTVTVGRRVGAKPNPRTGY